MGAKSQRIFAIAALAIISLLMGILCFGCSTPQKSLQIKSDSTHYDSAKSSVKIVKERYDSIIYHPRSLTKIELENICDSLGNLKPITIANDNGLAHSRVTINDKRITVNCDCDSIVSRITHESNSKDSMYAKLATASIMNAHNETNIVSVNKTPWWNEVLFIVLGLIILILIIYIIIQKFKI